MERKVEKAKRCFGPAKRKAERAIRDLQEWCDHTLRCLNHVSARPLSYSYLIDRVEKTVGEAMEYRDYLHFAQKDDPGSTQVCKGTSSSAPEDLQQHQFMPPASPEYDPTLPSDLADLVTEDSQSMRDYYLLDSFEAPSPTGATCGDSDSAYGRDGDADNEIEQN